MEKCIEGGQRLGNSDAKHANAAQVGLRFGPRAMGQGLSDLGLHLRLYWHVQHWNFRGFATYTANVVSIPRTTSLSCGHVLCSQPHCTPPRVPALPHSLTLSLAHSVTRSLTHSLHHSLTHSLAHSLTHSLAHSLTISSWLGTLPI